MNDLPTEQEINEWTKKSRKEGICGIVDCFKKPIKQCKKCTNYYCSEHFPTHLDLLPDGGFRFSNEGLENCMDFYSDGDNDFESNEGTNTNID